MQQIISNDGLTTKYIHKDKSETSFKMSHSGKFNSKNLITPITQDKEKYSLVISCSKGCQMKCTFCHLTQKGSTFEELTTEQVEQNLKDVIADQYEKHPEIGKKHIKFCWMGMGEAILKPEMIKTVSINVIDWALNNGYASGVDGIDVSTVLPKISNRWQETIKELVEETKDYPRNPNNTADRSLVRIFYSLHSANQEQRDKLIPNTKNIEVALDSLTRFVEETGIDIVYHYMFMNGVNDNSKSVKELISLYKNKNLASSELRILRYNEATNGVTESDYLKDIVSLLEQEIPKLKVQHSSGNKVASACGMFVVPEAS